ncbi:MAG: GGDEF domain-containing protein [Phycisphaerales bacterium]|jgi:diguanylate cyclase (GGDEF)-like protein|nr:GGDEF domain-containing protein [Phycisphaerales bacterium]
MSEVRDTRGTMLFVGSFDSELIAGIEQPTNNVNTLFDVLGELAVSSAKENIDAIVIDDHLLTGDSDSSFDAIRRVDPFPILVVTGESKHHQLADICIPRDTTSNRLISAITNARSQPTAIPFQADFDLDDALGLIDQSKSTPDGKSLGDVDLVRVLLHNPSQFRNTLLGLLKEQTQWKFCEFVDDETRVPHNAQHGQIRYGHQEHGILVAIGPTKQEVVRWARWASCWLELHLRLRRMKLLAYQDELSGAWNRRFLSTCLRREINQCLTQRRPLTVMIFDIDNFKKYNDQFGHDAGDEIIREIVRLLRATIRKGDHVCRIGGDEFAVLFCDPEPPRTQGSNHPTTVEFLAQRFRDQVSKAHFPKLGKDGQGLVSISGGLATFPWDGTEVDPLLQMADKRLLESKRHGKNTITFGKEL